MYCVHNTRYVTVHICYIMEYRGEDIMYMLHNMANYRGFLLVMKYFFVIQIMAIRKTIIIVI